MMYRNLCAMDVEEIARANPVDGLVLLVGCDKTTPAWYVHAFDFAENIHTHHGF